jgi:peptidoglycan/LPS O-acetylase OafA/YrhL
VELDTLRAFAIFSVLVHHFLPDNSVLNKMQQHLQQGPAFGVPLFFALSGFLITRILVQSRNALDRGLTSAGHSLYIFYARRFLRIFPIYYATLFFGVILKFKNIFHALPWHLAYLSNVYFLRRGAFDRGPDPVFWTLSVEEQFYLIWPLVFLLLPTRKLPVITLATAVIGGLCAAWASDRGAMINLQLPVHISYLALGSYLGLSETVPLGSETKQRSAMSYYWVAIAVLSIGMAVVKFTFPYSRIQLEASNGIRYIVFALLFAWIVARLSHGVGGPLGQLLRWAPLAYIGRISYGMYVVQFFVSQFMERGLPFATTHLGKIPAEWLLTSFPARVIAIIAVASVSWFCMEKPLNDLKRFFPYPSPRSAG